MIEINLLPPDMKPSEGTPPKRFALYVLWVAMAGVLIFFVLSFYQVKIPKLNSEIANTNTEIGEETKKKEIVDKTQKEIEDLKQKVAAFDNLNSSRVRLARVLDALCTAVASPETEGVWFKSMTIMPDAGTGKAAPGAAVAGKKYVIALKGFATGNNADDQKKRLSRLVTNLNTELRIAMGQPPSPLPDNYGFNDKLKVRFEPPYLKSFVVGPVPKPSIVKPKDDATLATSGKDSRDTKEDADKYEKQVLDLLKPPTEGIDFVLDLKFEMPAPKKVEVAPPPKPAAAPAKKS